MRLAAALLIIFLGLGCLVPAGYSQSNMIYSYPAYPRYSGYGVSSPAYYRGWLPPYQLGGPAYGYTYPCPPGYCPYPPGPPSYIAPPYPVVTPHYAGYQPAYGVPPAAYSPYQPGQPLINPSASPTGEKKADSKEKTAKDAKEETSKSKAKSTSKTSSKSSFWSKLRSPFSR